MSSGPFSDLSFSCVIQDKDTYPNAMCDGLSCFIDQVVPTTMTNHHTVGCEVWTIQFKK